jgi:hypothetical protein
MLAAQMVRGDLVLGLGLVQLALDFLQMEGPHFKAEHPFQIARVFHMHLDF